MALELIPDAKVLAAEVLHRQLGLSPINAMMMSRMVVDLKEENAMDRSEINRALAKALAYKQIGQQRDAETWARRLIHLLECENILVSDK